MWPFDRRGKQEYLRIGAHDVERWIASSAVMSQVGRVPLPRSIDGFAEGLEAAIRALYPSPPSTSVTVLLESCRLPVMHLTVGTALWTSAQIRPLLLHRLRQQYDDRRGSPSDWALRLDYGAGDRSAIGYGLSQQVQSSLVEAGQAAGLRWTAILPAFAWGLQRQRPERHLPAGVGWWVWPEQDRLLIARIEARKLVALNAGVPWTEDSNLIQRCVAAEAFRLGCGVTEDPIITATWSSVDSISGLTGRLKSLSITGTSRVQVPASQPIPLAGRVTTP